VSEGCVRGTVQAAKTRIQPLDEIPYLLSRLDEEGVPERCIEQWEGMDEDKHHRVSAEFLKPGAPLRADIDRISLQGFSPRLQSEVVSIAMVPLDDSVGEAPHAIAKQLLDHAKRSSWPFTAASMKLEANLEGVAELPAVVGCHMPDLWLRYKSILQSDPKHWKQPKRLSKTAFVDQVYRLNHFLPEDGDALTLETCRGDDPEGRDGPGHDDGHDDAGSHGGNDDDDHKPDVHRHMSFQERVHGRKAPRDRGQVDDAVSLMRQWLLAALQVYQFLSLPARGEDDNIFIVFVQVLSLELNPILLDVSQRKLNEEMPQFEIAVQTLERWAPPVEERVLRAQEEVFVYSDPQMVDILRLTGTDPATRADFKAWSCKPSDVDGCLSLHSASPLQVPMNLSNERIPVLCLIDELQEQGWIGVAQLVQHSPDGPKQFDSRRMKGKRWYYKVLLALHTLWPCGIDPFSSAQPQSFFQLLLLSKKEVPRGLQAKELRLLVQKCQGEAGALHTLDRLAAPPRHIAPAPAPAHHNNDIEGDEGAAAPRPEVRVAPDEHMAGDEPPKADPPPPEIAGVDEEPEHFIPARIEGQDVRVIAGRHGGGWNYHVRLSIICPHHDDCSKSRSLQLDRDVFGRRAAALFLGAWARGGAGILRENHKAPSRASVRAYADSLGEGAWH
jgi:hypothetical protein